MCGQDDWILGWFFFAFLWTSTHLGLKNLDDDRINLAADLHREADLSEWCAPVGE